MVDFLLWHLQIQRNSSVPTHINCHRRTCVASHRHRLASPGRHPKSRRRKRKRPRRIWRKENCRMMRKMTGVLDKVRSPAARRLLLLAKPITRGEECANRRNPTSRNPNRRRDRGRGRGLGQGRNLDRRLRRLATKDTAAEAVARGLRPERGDRRMRENIIRRQMCVYGSRLILRAFH